MKKIIFLCLLFFIQKANAQITLETSHTWSSNVSTTTEYGLDYFTYVGYKYYYCNMQSNSITIYNLNHSINRVIAIPPQSAPYNVYYLSTQLFDTDSSDFEYIVSHGYPYITTVYDENGTVLLHVDSFLVWTTYSTTTGGEYRAIQNTPAGAKLMLTHQNQLQTKVFRLPGYLPCPPCERFDYAPLPTSDGGENQINQEGLSQPYPNPSNGMTQIDYVLPEGETQGEIIFYDLAGQEIRRFQVDKTFNTLLLSTADLAAGTYFYQLQTKNNLTASKKLVVIH